MYLKRSPGIENDKVNVLYSADISAKLQLELFNNKMTYVGFTLHSEQFASKTPKNTSLDTSFFENSDGNSCRFT